MDSLLRGTRVFGEPGFSFFGAVRRQLSAIHCEAGAIGRAAMVGRAPPDAGCECRAKPDLHGAIFSTAAKEAQKAKHE